MPRWARKKQQQQNKKPKPGPKPEPTPPEGMDVSKALAARTKRTNEKKARFLKTLRETGVVSQACDAADLGRTTAYEWRDSDEEFAQQWDEALSACIEDAEAEAWKRGRLKSDLLLMFMLKAHKPELYRETTRVEQTGADGGPIEQHGTIEIIIRSDAQTRQVPSEPS